MKIGFLWSLINVAGNTMKQHIVMETPRQSIRDHKLLIEQAFSTGVDPYYKERTMIRFSMENPPIRQEGDITTVPMVSVFNACSGDFPKFHLYSRSHYLQFSQSVYASVIGYAEFCEMEDKLAHIVGNYIGDRNHNWLILMDDPLLMMNVRGYSAMKDVVDRTTWITTEKKGYEDMIIMDFENKLEKFI